MSFSKAEIEKKALAEYLRSGRGSVYFIGVLGVSMSSLALELSSRGFNVSGSDIAYLGGGTDNKSQGIRMSHLGKEISRGSKPDLIVYSLAIAHDDPERRIARRYGIPEVSRPVLLGALMLLYPTRVGISGTHGKSTTVAMLDKIAKRAHLSPKTFLGAAAEGDSSFKEPTVGETEGLLIYEACEYRDAFLHFSPTCAIITNIELDHTDYFKDEESLRRSFLESAKGAEHKLLSYDSPLSRSLLPELEGAVSFGRCEGADYTYSLIRSDERGSEIALCHRGEMIGELHIPIMGEYNAANAVAATVAALTLGVDFNIIKSALSCFVGVAGRLERLGEVAGRVVFSDYAHHPTALREVISALKRIYGRLTVVFRPHTYTRTRDFLSEFAKSLSLADRAVVTDIFPAREAPIEGITADLLAEMIPSGIYLPLKEIPDYLLSSTEGAILLAGAGDLSDVRHKLKSEMKKK